MRRLLPELGRAPVYAGLTGYGWQTGWTPFWAWFRGQPPAPRRFAERGAYRWLRHPVYLAFLGQIWLTPTATLDRFVMMVLLTVYVAVGSWLKDRRLLFYLGDAYRSYQARVPGYPVVGFGPLARMSDARLTTRLFSASRSVSAGVFGALPAASRLTMWHGPLSHPHVTSPGSNGLARSPLRGSTRTA